ncbi:hydroxypyruvate isomerase [Ereboglobus sp. PH5-10]|uniref:hydroxypyruvate isomerase family protein n=1 Tax=Ereboglobus sp. PH5-10 TaxID=2940629 RepID=UPI00240571F4|nr:TIM barrel protein [Ereboglobus sp. PH5-10]MDF9828576.1 hydroxypyruvate isomerase [Ereboglobus sp. PH5-10]
MTRRQAIKTIAATGALTALSRIVPQARAATTAPARDSFRHSVCPGPYLKRNADDKRPGRLPLPEFAQAAKKLGIESIELTGPEQWPVIQKAGLTCAVSTFPRKVTSLMRGLNRREHHIEIVPAYLQRIRECADAGIPNLICFSGRRDGQSDEEGLEICAEGLKKILPAAEKARVTLIMELLNSRTKGHVDYQCDHTAWGVELVKRVGSERFKLLYDIYHMQMMEGNIIQTIRENHQYIAHYHTAGNPGRNEFEPGDMQELNYPAIMRAIHDTGFRGYVGQEFSPKRDPLTSLAAAVKICTV